MNKQNRDFIVHKKNMNLNGINTIKLILKDG